jgi:hypothetical protein
VPKVLQTAAEFDLNLQIRRLLENDLTAPAEIEARLREAQDEGVTLDETTLMAFREAAERAADRFRQRPEALDRLEALETIVEIITTAKLPVELRRVQNRYYRMRRNVRPAIEAASQNGSSREWLDLFDALGEKLSLSPDRAPLRV